MHMRAFSQIQKTPMRPSRTYQSIQGGVAGLARKPHQLSPGSLGDLETDRKGSHSWHSCFLDDVQNLDTGPYTCTGLYMVEKNHTGPYLPRFRYSCSARQNAIVDFQMIVYHLK